ncbi:N-acetylmuramoyl-L-alanine amidase [Cohnella boryungensis]|uniref:N-acetylmuramoyl-L-alanine amidase n=1 Tax=Cohnella boryungensis TaxID=768479 RepID=A0ABV8S7K2_9BACL
MKKWFSLLFVVAGMLFLSAGLVHAAKAETLTPKLVLDGQALEPKVPPVVINQTVMIPLRIASESLGYKVDYDNSKKQVTVSNSSKKLVMTMDNPTAYLDNEPVQMTVPPTAKSNNLLIPLRFLSESLDVQVFWDNQIKSAFLYSPNLSNGGNTGGGLIGVVDGTDKPSDGTDGGGAVTTPNPETPAAPTGTLHEVRYEPDAIVIKYDGFIVPNAFKLDNPKRIVVDIPNTQYAEGFAPFVDYTQINEGRLAVEGHEALQSVRYSMFGTVTKAPRFVLDLNQAWDYQLVNDAIAGELRIVLYKPIPDNSIYTVVLDAGHGGTDPGASSLSKRPEKDFNLSVVLKVQALLASEERINLVLTRSDDTYPSLDARSELANSLKANLFVSVHANSFTPTTNGTETYYTREDSKEFANLMHPLLVAATGLKDNGVRTKSLSVTRKTTMPAILLEAGYLSSKIDEPKLWTDDFQNRVAAAIAQGIKMQLKLI